jgi:hypothetical protein
MAGSPERFDEEFMKSAWHFPQVDQARLASAFDRHMAWLRVLRSDAEADACPRKLSAA